MALASDIKRSTPNNNARPSTGMVLMLVRVDANTTNPLPVTPAAAYEVTMSIPIMDKSSPQPNCT